MSNHWELRKNIVANSWNLAEEEDGEDTSGGSETTKGHATMILLALHFIIIVATSAISSQMLEQSNRGAAAAARGYVQLHSGLKSPSGYVWLDLVSIALLDSNPIYTIAATYFGPYGET